MKFSGDAATPDYTGDGELIQITTLGNIACDGRQRDACWQTFAHYETKEALKESDERAEQEPLHAFDRKKQY